MTNVPDDVNTPVIAAVGLLGTVVVFVIIILLVAVFYRVQMRHEFVKDVSQPQVEVAQLAAQQRANLAEYRLLDRESQVYAIPIRQAMEAIVAQRRENPEGPAGVEPAEAMTPADQSAPPAEGAASAAAAAEPPPPEPKPEGGRL